MTQTIYIAPDSIELKSNNEETDTFIAKIGKSIEVANVKDMTIISHLIEDIKTYQNDQQQLLAAVSHLEDENTQLQLQITTLKQDNHVLANEAKIHKQELADQKEDFMEAARSLSIQSLENMNILDKTEITHLKDSVSEKTMEHFKSTIAKHAEVKLPY